MSGSASACATAYWNGPPLTNVRNCLAVFTAATSSGTALAQPIFQPVKANVLPAELTDTPVRPETERSPAVFSVALKARRLGPQSRPTRDRLSNARRASMDGAGGNPGPHGVPAIFLLRSEFASQGGFLIEAHRGGADTQATSAYSTRPGEANSSTSPIRTARKPAYMGLRTYR